MNRPVSVSLCVYRVPARQSLHIDPATALRQE
jgi:hypothetical protein